MNPTHLFATNLQLSLMQTAHRAIDPARGFERRTASIDPGVGLLPCSP